MNIIRYTFVYEYESERLQKNIILPEDHQDEKELDFFEKAVPNEVSEEDIIDKEKESISIEDIFA